MGTLLDKLFRRAPAGKLPEAVARQLDLRKRLDLKAELADAEMVAFDTELTGLDPRRDSIVSIGAVKLKGGRIFPARTFSRLVKPESALTRQSVLVHGITPSDVEQAASQDQVLEEFLEFIGDAILIGHFVHIDVNFVSRALKTLYGIRLRNPAVDTASIHDWLYENDSRFARHFRGMSVKTDLFSVARHYGIVVGKVHDALEDAFITAQLFQRFYPFFPACGIRTVKELLMVGAP